MVLDALAPNPCLKNTAAGGNNLWLQFYYRVAPDCGKNLKHTLRGSITQRSNWKILLWPYPFQVSNDGCRWFVIFDGLLLSEVVVSGLRGRCG